MENQRRCFVALGVPLGAFSMAVAIGGAGRLLQAAGAQAAAPS